MIPYGLWTLVVREWRHHPWRHGVALLAVALGVALAWSVHLINGSALSEFSAAVRAANGQPDAVVRGAREGFDDRLLDRIAALAEVERASPVVEIDTHALDPAGRRLPLRVLGLDVLVAAPLAPEVMPRPSVAAGGDRLAAIDPERAFVNAAARERLGLRDGEPIRLQAGPRWVALEVSGSVAAGGPPLVVVDIAAAQAHFGLLGRLTRIDLRLAPGAAVATLRPQLPPALELVPADEAEQRLANVSRAYRVNLTVLALVALFVGAFLVFSVVSLSVAQRTPALALLGVLGLTAAERRHLVLAECGALGAAGSVLGLALGTAMAAWALRWLAGDLGGGYFPGIAPPLRIPPTGLVGFLALGVASSLVGGWIPALRAQQLRPALALKGLGDPDARPPPAWPGVALLAAGALLALAPPVAGLPLGAYLSVAALLFGGVALVPVAVQGLLALLPPPRGALALLAIERARFHRRVATAAVAGVVASLALGVALTVMVSSFRLAVAQWLDQVLPADIYLRTAASSVANDQAWLEPSFVEAVARLPGIDRVRPARTRALVLAPGQPHVTLIARDLGDPAATLALVGPASPPRPGERAAYVSEATAMLYGAGVGRLLALPLGNRSVDFRVLGVFRDYARQFGTVAIDGRDYEALTGDRRVNELALWLAPGADLAAVQRGLRAAAPDPAMIDFAGATELRRVSLAIFDRSFAVTRYLQAVAIGIALVGIAASLSAQVLARRKEFGLLAHLGLQRRQTIALVVGEAAAWLAAGALLGVLLGLAVSVVLVHVVNPQSFHWTMELALPWARLAGLAAAVMAAGLVTAGFTARQAATRQAVLAVKEDW